MGWILRLCSPSGLNIIFGPNLLLKHVYSRFLSNFPSVIVKRPLYDNISAFLPVEIDNQFRLFDLKISIHETETVIEFRMTKILCTFSLSKYIPIEILKPLF